MPTDSWLQKAAEEIARGMVRHLPGCMGRPLLGEGMGPCDRECAAHRAPALVGIAAIIQRHAPAPEPPTADMPAGGCLHRMLYGTCAEHPAPPRDEKGKA